MSVEKAGNSSTVVPARDALDAYVARGLLTCRESGPLSIYNYTDHCTYERAWDDVTKQARGLIFHGEQLIALPFPKFFNHGEADASVPSGRPDVAMVKYDGSLGISYRCPISGRIRWSTRGSLESAQAAVADRIWRTHYSYSLDAAVPEGLTLLTEIVHPETRNVARHDFEGLVLLGAREICSGRDLPYSEVSALASDLCIPCAEMVEPDLEALIERSRTMGPDSEGWVLRWGDHRVKVKGAAYLRVAKILAGLATPRNVADIWYAGDDRIRASLPEEYRLELDAAFSDLDRAAEEVREECDRVWAGCSQISDRKLFVDAVGGPKSRVFSLLMLRFAGRPWDPRALVYHERHGGKPRDVQLLGHGAA